MSARWVPHHPETWPWRVGKLKCDVEMRTWHGHHADPQFTYVTAPAGTPVKIVMVSRLGDVGITTDLTAENGYKARVMLEEIEPSEPTR